MKAETKRKFKKKYLELVGKRIERTRLFVNAISHKDEKYRVFLNCTCDCGKRIVVNARDVLMGATRSCGCLQKEKTKAFSKIQPSDYDEFLAMLHDENIKKKDICERFNISRETFRKVLRNLHETPRVYRKGTN